MARVHLQEELSKTTTRVIAETKYGPVTGGRAANGAAVYLEVPYAMPPGRFEDPRPLVDGFRYAPGDYIYESRYCAQPHNDGQAAGVPYEDKVGLGEATENICFVTIVCPPAFPARSGFPVKVYIHGGFLQFGSPHGLGGQAQYVVAERQEVWVNIGYRVSAFGFLASETPRLDGNYGFRDQWLALLWIRDNIQAFGGNPDDIQITGLSAGGHSVHQILHYASRLHEGELAPFHSAIIQSNSIVIAPKTRQELQSQFEALCRALNLDPAAPNILTTLRDPAQVPASAITHAIETDALGVQYGTFRGCLDNSWMSASPEPMEWQRSGDLARALRARGVRCIVVGDLTEEWYLYSIAHPIATMRDIELNMERYYPVAVVEKMIRMYPAVPDDAPPEEFRKLFGEMLSEGQVHLPVRLLARDLLAAGFPVVRYEIAWTPEQVRPLGYVTHGTDRPLWTIRLPALEPVQTPVARAWWEAISAEVQASVDGTASVHGLREVLALKEDKTIGWKKDEKWGKYMRLVETLPGEQAL